MLIVIEGQDATGKDTQADHLGDQLVGNGLIIAFAYANQHHKALAYAALSLSVDIDFG